MAHECFENVEIAGLMNQDFINVKVDREERRTGRYLPKVRTGVSGTGGGWPLTMFLTPDQEPFYGGRISRGARYNLPGFPDVLRVSSRPIGIIETMSAECGEGETDCCE